MRVIFKFLSLSQPYQCNSIDLPSSLRPLYWRRFRDPCFNGSLPKRLSKSPFNIEPLKILSYIESSNISDKVLRAQLLGTEFHYGKITATKLFFISSKKQTQTNNDCPRNSQLKKKLLYLFWQAQTSRPRSRITYEIKAATSNITLENISGLFFYIG